MKFNSPFSFLGQVLVDCVRRPQVIRNAISGFANTRSYTHPSGELPIASIFDLVPNAETIPVTMQGIFELPLFPREDAPLDRRETASTSLRDSYYLALLIRHLGASRILEVGTSFGESSLLFAMNSSDEARVLTLDIQKDNPTVGACFKDTPYSRKIEQHYCSLREVTSRLELGEVDFAFIDGDHSYRGVLEDSYIIQKSLRPGGIICWHDYSFRFRNDVVKALDYLREKEKWGIRKILYSNLCVYAKDVAD